MGILEIVTSGINKVSRLKGGARKATREEAGARGSDEAPKGREVAMGTEQEGGLGGLSLGL
jgi:hypothetical protein